MSAVTIRKAEPRDVPFILAMIRELAEYERDPNAAVATEEMIHRHLFGEWVGRAPMIECFIGEVEGSAEGIALYFHNYSTWTGRPGTYLEDLFVRPSARGKGLGKALLRRVAQVAVERGCPRLEWMVIDWNEPAQEFYRSVGARGMDGWTVWRLDGDALARLGAPM